jgi:hypothetical protein
MQVILHEPDGNQLQSPDLGYLESLILTEGVDYWEAGSGDICIEYGDPYASSLILIFCNEANGFYLEYIPEKGVYDSFISISNSAINNENVTLRVGGEDHKVPLQTILSRENTLDVVKEFIETGAKFHQTKWLKKSEIEWPIDEDL